MDSNRAYRLLPALDELMRDERASALVERLGRERILELAGARLAAWRAEIKAGSLGVPELEGRLAEARLWAEIEAEVVREEGSGVVRCVNATGVVLNTGLGRAPVHPEVARAMAVAAQSYVVLEVDRFTNSRNQRDDHLGELLARLTGAEAAIAVNNCAAAVLLAFQTFAGGREAIVSRGELVEIGGSFRVPDVMARANATLVEVGTTNRTRIGDFERAITPRTGLLVKVHTSNFRVVGFAEEVRAQELANLGRERAIPSVYDLGSGLFEFEGAEPLAPLLGDEPLVRDAVQSGVDVVLFSGDKLFGGPQAGMLVGRSAAIAALRKNPIYRAVRLDKVTLAGLEATVRMCLAGRAAGLPTRRLLSASAASIRPRAEALAAELRKLPGLSAAVIPEHSQPGSGSAPGILLATFVVRVTSNACSAEALARSLREAPVPVFTRIQADQVLVDPRTLLPGDETDLLAGFRFAAGRGTTPRRP